MKPPRFTVRRLLVVVALVALALGLAGWMTRRADRFRFEASRHVMWWLVYESPNSARAEHHLGLARKYEAAARRPWLPVEPDAPELE